MENVRKIEHIGLSAFHPLFGALLVRGNVFFCRNSDPFVFPPPRSMIPEPRGLQYGRAHLHLISPQVAISTVFPAVDRFDIMNTIIGYVTHESRRKKMTSLRNIEEVGVCLDHKSSTRRMYKKCVNLLRRIASEWTKILEYMRRDQPWRSDFCLSSREKTFDFSIHYTTHE